VEKYYQAMEQYDPEWQRPSKIKKGRGKKRAAADELEDVDGHDDDANECEL